MKLKVLIIIILIIILSLYLYQSNTRSPYRGKLCISILNSIYKAEIEFKINRYIDQNNNEIGEYGFLGELIGYNILRGKKNKLQPILCYWDHINFEGFPTPIVDGYHFKLFLPNQGQILSDTGKNQKNSTSTISIDAQEKWWICYAWPAIFKFKDYQNCYVINESGEILYSSNLNENNSPIYSGNRFPLYDAAMSDHLFTIRKKIAQSLRERTIPPELFEEFSLNYYQLSASSNVSISKNKKYDWIITDEFSKIKYFIKEVEYALKIYSSTDNNFFWGQLRSFQKARDGQIWKKLGYSEETMAKRLEFLKGKNFEIFKSDSVNDKKEYVYHLENKLIFVDSKLSDEEIVYLSKRKNLKEIDLFETNLGDAELFYLSNIEGLEKLRLISCRNITDRGLYYLKNLKKLASINLDGSQIKGEGFIYLKNLKKLWYLSISRCQIIDQNLLYLTEIPTLEYINLSKNKITNSNLKYFSKLMNLKRLDLSENQITRQEIEKLRKEMPWCNIDF